MLNMNLVDLVHWRLQHWIQDGQRKMPFDSLSLFHLQKKNNTFAKQFWTAPSQEETRKNLKKNQRVRKMKKSDFTVCSKMRQLCNSSWKSGSDYFCYGTDRKTWSIWRNAYPTLWKYGLLQLLSAFATKEKRTDCMLVFNRGTRYVCHTL